ncbi:uncharacterized protein LOC124900597 isoform X2 [Homo sapiens]|uniref:uncharacterized protein LOC124900597 isoform X2 n=1 Tax=Homo sapiens TaxID=9606 RepID=UPI001FB14378|nr:uncharacterized protein LOC124900597 isoform X2 [Homo sapiens]XP_047303073.1 uncharacterized protein LOC124900597 isoform X2 [Homo sapiens]XP_047303124.1 uncharacterized protein LOC124900597 isoform X2 [Homo sapiens]
MACSVMVAGRAAEREDSRRTGAESEWRASLAQPCRRLDRKDGAATAQPLRRRRHAHSPPPRLLAPRSLAAPPGPAPHQPACLASEGCRESRCVPPRTPANRAHWLRSPETSRPAPLASARPGWTGPWCWFSVPQRGRDQSCYFQMRLARICSGRGSRPEPCNTAFPFQVCKACLRGEKKFPSMRVGTANHVQTLRPVLCVLSLQPALAWWLGDPPAGWCCLWALLKLLSEPGGCPPAWAWLPGCAWQMLLGWMDGWSAARGT